MPLPLLLLVGSAAAAAAAAAAGTELEAGSSSSLRRGQRERLRVPCRGQLTPPCGDRRVDAAPFAFAFVSGKEGRYDGSNVHSGGTQQAMTMRL